MAKEFKMIEHETPWRYETEDGLTCTRGSAWSGPGCHLGCGVLLYTDKDGKLVRIEGDPENPFNKGRLCVRCLDAMEAVYHKDRLTTPLKRDPSKRGKDEWEPITWDEAYDLIYEKFNGFREKYGPESVAFFQGTGRDIAPWITRFAWSFGSPNNVFGMSGNSCYGPRVAGAMCVTGSFWVGDYSQQFVDRYDDPNWKVPEVIVVWGNNPLKSNSDGLYGHWVVDCMKRGSKIITIDPRRIWLANKAEVHLPIRPGTDAAMALGMLNVIIGEDLYDHEFVDCWTYGFAELAEHVKEWTPERAGEVCWCDPDDIRRAARIIAKADGCVFQWGVAVDMQKNAVAAGHAITCIQAITANIDNPGGMICPDYILMYFSGWGRELLDPEKRANRIGDSKYPMVADAYSKADADEVYHCIMTGKNEKGEDHPMKGAWIQTTNFLVNTAPDPEYLIEAFHKLEFVAAIDMFMTPTIMELADVVLPAASFPERQGIRIGDGVQRAETINRAVDRRSEGIDVRSDMQVNRELGKRFRPEAYPWDNEEDMFSSIFSETGMSFEEVREKAPVYLPFEYYKYKTGKLRADGKPGFNTRTGRIELWCTLYNGYGLDPLPIYEEPVHSPVRTPEEYEEFPVVLTTGSRNWSLFHSEHRQIPRMRALHPDPTVLVPTDVAERFGIKTGEWVVLRNQFGKCKRKVIIDDTMAPGIASTDHGWWLPESEGRSEEDGLFGAFEYNCNMLFKFDQGKSGFGCDYKNMLVTIDKIEEE
ncbi:molybdopterin-dependent oxidoreductase [Ellagibacter isourolithinifaciens]|uniref:molybdopterin-dependent oxidoreductase n=1 Tax=Ellagibacter isourolithinifaciens TaxID=2137581 RepID=UPI0023F035DF|nr:molybdopterin-dependent oxidoreductase [Ellagibacter isourolithinifaciens]MDD5925847.1 molybdopterin-dependent oxidoreductase [Ellagibacter isourolithinifaciens]